MGAYGTNPDDLFKRKILRTATVEDTEFRKLQERLAKLRELFARPGNPSEQQAAAAAMIRVETKMLALRPAPSPALARKIKTLGDVAKEPSAIDPLAPIKDPEAYF